MEQLERELQIMLAKLSGIGYDLFLLALIAVMALLAYHFIKWKKAEETAQIPLPTEADLRRLPNDLDKLRRKYLLAGTRKKKYYLQRKICEVGMERFRRGVIKSPDALSRLMSEMYEHMFTRPEDPAFTLRCLNCYMEMAPHSMSTNSKELATVELELVEYCSEGKYCPRDARRAREYLKKAIRRGTSSTNRDPGVYTPHMLQLMEVIGADAFGMDFLMEQIRWMYWRYSYAYHLNRKGAVEVSCANNGDSLALYQAVKLLRQMDGAALDGDVKTMLVEYQRCADAGNAYAQYKLGQFYLTGRFAEKDRKKGLALLKKASEQDFDLAAKLLREETTGRSGSHTMDRKLFEKLAAELDEIVFLHKHAQTYRALPWGKSPEELAKAVLKESGSFIHDLLECLSEAKCPAALRKELENYFDKRRSAAAAVVEREERTSSAAGGEEKGPYKGRFGVTDDEVPFNSTILPERITGPFGVVYHRISLYTDSAEYVSDTGESTTIHLADIGFAGQSARNSDGYFYW